ISRKGAKLAKYSLRPDYVRGLAYFFRESLETTVCGGCGGGLVIRGGTDVGGGVRFGGFLGDGSGEGFAVGVAEGFVAFLLLRLFGGVERGVHGLCGRGDGVDGPGAVDPEAGAGEHESDGGEFEDAQDFLRKESAEEASAHEDGGEEKYPGNFIGKCLHHLSNDRDIYGIALDGDVGIFLAHPSNELFRDEHGGEAALADQGPVVEFVRLFYFGERDGGIEGEQKLEVDHGGFWVVGIG